MKKNILLITAFTLLVLFVFTTCEWFPYYANYYLPHKDNNTGLSGTLTVSERTPVVGDTIIATYTPTPDETGPFTYEWFYEQSPGNWVAVTSTHGATSATNTANDTITPTTAGKYKVRVTDTSTGRSAEEEITVTPVPPLQGTIDVDQRTRNVLVDTAIATYTPVAGENGPFTYAWEILFEGVWHPVDDTIAIVSTSVPGKTNDSITPKSPGTYRVIVKDEDTGRTKVDTLTVTATGHAGNLYLHPDLINPILNSNVTTAVAYVNNPANNSSGQVYTLRVHRDDTVDSSSISYWSGAVYTAAVMEDNARLTIEGIGGVRTITHNGGADHCMFIIDGTSSLTLGNNITLQGHQNGTQNLVMLNDGEFIMKGNSRITGHKITNYWPSLVAVWGGHFTMEDNAVITGNEGLPLQPTPAQYSTASGGVTVGYGTFTMNGGSITGNSPFDVTVLGDATFELSGNSNIGKLTLNGVRSLSTDYAQISATGSFTGSIGELNLWYDASVSPALLTLAEIQTAWMEVTGVVIGSASSNITSVLNRINSLGSFISRLDRGEINEPIASTHHICNNAAGGNHGRLIAGTKASCGCP